MNKSLFNLSIKPRSFANGWYEPGEPVALHAVDIDYRMKPVLSVGFPDWEAGVAREERLVPLRPAGLSEKGRADGTDVSHQSSSLPFLF